MNDIDQAILDLKTVINNDPIVREFLKVKEAINCDFSLKNLQNEIISLTKQNKIKEMKLLKEQYDNHPLVVNYNYLKEEVKDLLIEIKEVIEK